MKGGDHTTGVPSAPPVPLSNEKEELGEVIYEKIVSKYPSEAAKLTGMLLQMDYKDLEYLVAETLQWFDEFDEFQYGGGSCFRLTVMPHAGGKINHTHQKKELQELGHLLFTTQGPSICTNEGNILVHLHSQVPQELPYEEYLEDLQGSCGNWDEKTWSSSVDPSEGERDRDDQHGAT
ncbi:putative Poly-adenylate binding protein domain-containing protein [Homarus americanus]|uniref:Putative Poly-adenylate binding protein domain-containing protein n=1 Tax=Homarus americanus TaxID=6706 RepID=A0A8J5JWZ4_HOMAM|nr:putative Poly-adenylate binding protein domain-containing protein [Homarus americanus]